MVAVIIILFLLGIAAFVVSVFIKENNKEENNTKSDEYLEQLLAERIDQVEHRIGDVAEKSASSIQRQAIDELEKLSREKLSEVNEYSDQVMDRINKNHNEVMFLYGLLSDKQKELDETVESLNRAQKELNISQRLDRQEKKNAQIKNDADGNTSSFENGHMQHISADKNTGSDENYGRRAQILMLAKEGKSELEIAKQLSMGVGEVRLVLELSKGV